MGECSKTEQSLFSGKQDLPLPGTRSICILAAYTRETMHMTIGDLSAIIFYAEKSKGKIRAI